MHYYFIILGTVAGLCLGFGLMYLFIAVRRKNHIRVPLTFSIFALSYGATLLNGIGFYSATSVTEYLAITRWDSLVVAAAFVSLIWFVAYYTGEKSRIIVWALTAAIIVPVVVRIFGQDMYVGEISGLTHITLPWGEKLTHLENSGSFWSDFRHLTWLSVLVYIVYALIRQYRRGAHRAAVLLGVGMLWFVVAISLEIAAGFDYLTYFPWGEFGFLPLAIVMSLHMANEVIETEEELSLHREHLEELVEARAAMLEKANLSLTQEIVERQQAERDLTRRLDELAALHRTAHLLTTMTELPVALQQVSEIINDLFGVHFTHIVLSLDDSGMMMVFGFGQDEYVAESLGEEMVVPELPAVQPVLVEGRPVIIADIQAEALPEQAREFFIRQNIHSVLLVPLKIRSVVVGLLSLEADWVGRSFSADEVRLAETFASDIVAAVENTRLLGQARIAAAAEERHRLARDLHDAVTQTIYAASLIVEALPDLWERRPEAGRRNLVKVRQLVRGALAEMRTLLFELRPGSLDGVRLDTLLLQLGDVLTGRTQTPVEVMVRGEAEVPGPVKVAFYHIAQEALNNIAKHARASEVSVTLQPGPNLTILTIQDDGIGFDPGEVSAAQMGLRIMRERAEEIGATLLVESEPGQGTQVTASWAQAPDNGIFDSQGVLASPAA